MRQPSKGTKHFEEHYLLLRQLVLSWSSCNHPLETFTRAKRSTEPLASPLAIIDRVSIHHDVRKIFLWRRFLTHCKCTISDGSPGNFRRGAVTAAAMDFASSIACVVGCLKAPALAASTKLHQYCLSPQTIHLRMWTWPRFSGTWTQTPRRDRNHFLRFSAAIRSFATTPNPARSSLCLSWL